MPVRKVQFDFSDLPRWWFGGEIFPTHLVNGLHLLFPAGERFFIRSVRRYVKEIDDPDLVARVKGFFGQEGHHGVQHEAAFATLEQQGFLIRPFLAWYERLAFDRIEAMTPPVLRLAVTAAAEHFTATFAEEALATPLLDDASPAMRDLLRWHAAEEIEHKAVAFDVLQHVDDRYAVRVAGLLMASALLVGFWQAGTRMLLRQEPHAARRDIPAQRRRLRRAGRDGRLMKRAFVDYLRRDFHPDQTGNTHLAHSYLASIGRLSG